MSDARRPGREMSTARFAAILDAYGAEPRRWPAAERAAAEALLASSAEARRLHEHALPLDLALNDSPAPGPSAALKAAVLKTAPSARRAMPTRPRGFWVAVACAITGELGGPRPAGAVLGAALVLGIVAGGAVGTGAAVDPEIDIVHLALLDEQFSGY